MSNLTRDTLYTTHARGRARFTVANTVQLYAGSIVGTNAAGYAALWADTAGHQFAGIALEAALGDTSASPPVEVMLDTSGPIVEDVAVASAVQGSVNSLVYCTTDNLADCTLSAGTNVEAIGYVHRFKSAGVADVCLFTPTEHLALN